MAKHIFLFEGWLGYGGDGWADLLAGKSLQNNHGGNLLKVIASRIPFTPAGGSAGCTPRTDFAPPTPVLSTTSNTKPPTKPPPTPNPSGIHRAHLHAQQLEPRLPHAHHHRPLLRRRRRLALLCPPLHGPAHRQPRHHFRPAAPSPTSAAATTTPPGPSTPAAASACSKRYFPPQLVRPVSKATPSLRPPTPRVQNHPPTRHLRPQRHDRPNLERPPNSTSKAAIDAVGWRDRAAGRSIYRRVRRQTNPQHIYERLLRS